MSTGTYCVMQNYSSSIHFIDRWVDSFPNVVCWMRTARMACTALKRPLTKRTSMRNYPPESVLPSYKQITCISQLKRQCQECNITGKLIKKSLENLARRRVYKVKCKGVTLAAFRDAKARRGLRIGAVDAG